MKATFALLACIFLPAVPQLILAWLLNEHEKKYNQNQDHEHCYR